VLQIIARIMETGFRDGENSTYRPHLVRFGRGQGKHVRPVSLDNLGELPFAVFVVQMLGSQKRCDAQWKLSRVYMLSR
jgi:hypothetical protein